MWVSTLDGAAQLALRSVKEIAPKSLFWCVNRIAQSGIVFIQSLRLSFACVLRRHMTIYLKWMELYWYSENFLKVPILTYLGADRNKWTDSSKLRADMLTFHSESFGGILLLKLHWSWFPLACYKRNWWISFVIWVNIVLQLVPL